MEADNLESLTNKSMQEKKGPAETVNEIQQRGTHVIHKYNDVV